MKVSKLNVEDFTDQTAEHFAVGLAESQSVQVLKSNISSTGAVSIFTSLEELDLSSNLQLEEGDSEAAGCAIERMLNVNRTLKVLKVWYWKSVGTPITTHIAAALAHDACLTELDIVSLFKYRFTNEGCVHVFNALYKNTSLKRISAQTYWI